MVGLLWSAWFARLTGNEVNKAKVAVIVGNIIQSCDPTHLLLESCQFYTSK